MKWFGYNFPFTVDDKPNSIQKDERLIKNDIMQLLLTVPGERVNKPKVGAHVRDQLFEGISDESIDIVIDNIRDAIETNEPRFTVSEVRIERHDDNNRFDIKIYGHLNLSNKRNLAIEFSV